MREERDKKTGVGGREGEGKKEMRGKEEKGRELKGSGGTCEEDWGGAGGGVGSECDQKTLYV